jgi:phenylpyruvate tautomerase PptA (4-oxalocrotonate tautomerase family)
MPLLNIYTSALTPAPDATDKLLKTISSSLSKLLGKPEQYVMTCLMPPARMTFAGNFEPSCYAELKNIGALSADTTAKLSAELCQTLSQALGVPQNRIYIEFANIEPHLWGFDGETFA